MMPTWQHVMLITLPLLVWRNLNPMTRIDDPVVEECVDQVHEQLCEHAEHAIHWRLMHLTDDHLGNPILVPVWSRMHRWIHMQFKDV
jgi:hypothetical protein